ncbi:MAG: hypothetical protein PHS57_08095 [Alphaproteobacteria bacterium]|nr:hypothetical protein [Alphaproteobacteria bacterium]
MEEAYVLSPEGGIFRVATGSILSVNGELYVCAREYGKDLAGKIVCPHCGQPVTFVEEKDPVYGKPKLAFRHTSDGDATLCPEVKLTQNAARGIYDNTFDASVIQANVQMMERWDVINRDMLRKMMVLVVGGKAVQADGTFDRPVQNKLDRIKYHMRSLVGLAEYPWLLPFLQAYAFGTCVRQTVKGKGNRRYGFSVLSEIKSSGDDSKELLQKLPTEAGLPLKVPKTLVLSLFHNTSGAPPVPVTPYGGRGPLIFEVSYQGVENTLGSLEPYFFGPQRTIADSAYAEKKVAHEIPVP